METPRLDLMNDKQYCQFMINQVADDLKRGSGYLSKVQSLASEAGHSFSELQISQVRTGRGFNRIIAYFIHMAGLQIRQESMQEAAA